MRVFEKKKLLIYSDYHKAPSLATMKSFRCAYLSTRGLRCTGWNSFATLLSNPLTFSRGS